MNEEHHKETAKFHEEKKTVVSETHFASEVEYRKFGNTGLLQVSGSI